MSLNFDGVKVGLCKVIVDPDAVGPAVPFVIDQTKGNVKFTCTEKTKPITIDQTADTPIKLVRAGVDAFVEVPIAVSTLDVLKVAFPSATKTTNATTSTSALTLSAKAGVDMLQYAKKVRIEPINGTVEDHITLIRAIPEANLKQAYEIDGVRVVDVKFTAIPDPNQDYATVIFGDETANA